MQRPVFLHSLCVFLKILTHLALCLPHMPDCNPMKVTRSGTAVSRTASQPPLHPSLAIPPPVLTHPFSADAVFVLCAPQFPVSYIRWLFTFLRGNDRHR